ncbi:uncharacterized protein HKW66_Vig0204320 [Vigna angularis]|uniref:Uncharacterized protein n=1 Tax=Phaseolus angularis TaxID=3914 RepID=A0A8T0JW12_PHAAN|nr:uncharacterized protein HKW66_Vig0204320 [Vigna angularis]
MNVGKGDVITPMDDLEVPPIIDYDEGHGGKIIGENEGHVEEDDDYINQKGVSTCKHFDAQVNQCDLGRFIVMLSKLT